MEHLNDVIVTAGVIGVPALTAATIALAVFGQRHGARLYRKYATADTNTVLDQAAAEKAEV